MYVLNYWIIHVRIIHELDEYMGTTWMRNRTADVIIMMYLFISLVYVTIYWNPDWRHFLPDVVKRGGHLRPLEQAALGHGQHLFRGIPRRVISSLLARNLAFSSPTFAPTPTTALCCAIFGHLFLYVLIYLSIHTHFDIFRPLRACLTSAILPIGPNNSVDTWSRKAVDTFV